MADSLYLAIYFFWHREKNTNKLEEKKWGFPLQDITRVIIQKKKNCVCCCTYEQSTLEKYTKRWDNKMAWKKERKRERLPLGWVQRNGYNIRM